jgi:hypothetical protein
MSIFAKVRIRSSPPICPSDILPPKRAGRDYRATASLAPFGGKGLSDRVVEVKKIHYHATFAKTSYFNR